MEWFVLLCVIGISLAGLSERTPIRVKIVILIMLLLVAVLARSGLK